MSNRLISAARAMPIITKLLLMQCLWVLVFSQIALAQSWEFNTNGNREGWSTNNVESWSVNGGIFYIDPAASDPSIERTGFSLSASSYNTVHIRMASNAPDGGGTIYFQTSTSSGWIEARNVHFSVVNQPGGSAPYYEYKVFMAYHPQWQGTITGIRIDPANNGQSGTNLDTIGIDFIRLISSSDRPAIVNQSLSHTSATPGTTITFNYTISNPFSNYMPYRFDAPGMRLGARIRPVGTSSWIDDPANDQVIMLQPGPPAGLSPRTYSRSYRISPQASSGSYDAGWILVVQSVSPEQWISEKVVFGALQVTAPPSSPTLLIDGGTSSRKQQGASFSFNGSNFTPNTTAQQHIIKPNGQDVGGPISVSSNGTISWTFPSGCSTDTGTYDIWVTDTVKGNSNHVTEIIDPNPSCNPTDTTPPDTQITAGPSGTITTNSATFTWTGSDNVTPTANLVYAYRLDPIEPNFSSFGSATSKTYSGLANGTYTFYVKARDQASNEDPTPASRTFTVSVTQNPVLEVTPNSLNFGDVTVGQCSTNQSFTVRNAGGGTLTGTASTSAPFSIVSGSSFSLGANQSAQVTVRFCPTVTGPASGQVNFTSNGGSASQLVSGNSVSQPQADLVVASLSADPATPNSGQIVTFTVRVQNQGQAASGSFNVGLTVGGTALPNKAVTGLDIGQTTDVRFTWTASCTQGSNTTLDIMATADVRNEVPESDEGNNTRSGTIVVNCSLRELIVGQLMIKADKILLTGDGIYEAQGNITINNFIRTTSINLKIDTKRLRVEGEGKIILSEVRFIGDLTLFEGKFVLGADPPEFLFSSTVPASFQIGKLGVEISKLRLSLDGVGGTFSVIIPNIRVPDGTSKIKIEDLMISRTTGIEAISLELENVSLIDGFALRTLRLAYDRESDSWSAQGQLEIPLPKGCILLDACLLLDASIRLQDGILDQIGVGVDNLNKPIMAAVFLQRVALEADGLAPGPPPVKLTGSVGFTGGPKIHDMYIIRVDGTGSIDATGRIELGAVVFVLSDEGKIASATVILDPASDLSISGELDLASIFVVRGNLVLDLSSNFQGQLQGSAKFPKNWPLIGNREIKLVTAYVDNTLFSSEILLFTVVYTPRKDVNCWWDWGNWHVGCNLSQLQSQTMGPSALSAGSTREELVVVPPSLPFVVFRATYEGSPVELSLIDPAGKTITKETAGLDPQKYLYSENPEIAEVYFAVKLPQPGTWKLLISRDAQSSADLSSQGSGEVELQVLIGNRAPSLTIVQPARRTVGGKKIKIEWKANDDDPSARLSLFYDKDNKGVDGQLIVAGLPATNGKYEWDTQQVPNGVYYIYGVVNDGYNAPIISYSKGRVEVKNTIKVLIGDANQDGVVDNRDVQDINAARASLLIACDVNKPIGTCDDKDASLISQALDASGNLKPLSKRPRSLNSLHKGKRIGETVAVIMPTSSTSFAVQGIPILVNTFTARGPVMVFEALHEGVASVELNVFDLSGRRVFSAASSSGVRKTTFSGHDQQGRMLGNGVYLYVVRVRGYDGREYVSEVRKLVILR